MLLTRICSAGIGARSLSGVIWYDVAKRNDLFFFSPKAVSRHHVQGLTRAFEIVPTLVLKTEFYLWFFGNQRSERVRRITS